MQKSEETVRFYFDQNIIDYLIKGNLNFLEKIISEIKNSVIVYSPVTIKEFSRIEDDIKRESYLNFLKNNDAQYFWIDNNEYAHFEKVDPHYQYNELKSESSIIYKGLEESMLARMHKSFGGKKNVGSDEIAKYQKVSFNELMEFMNKNLDSLNNSFQIDVKLLKNYTKSMGRYFNELIDESVNLLEVNSTDHPLREFRKLFGVNIVELNNITPPNIIPQIWERIKDTIKTNGINLTFNDLFGDGLMKYYLNQKITKIMKVNGLYNLLNSIGYYPDKNIENDKEFFRFFNDQLHIGYAIYSNYFVTRDKRLMKKTEAVYEHLKIGTQVIFIQ
jgi:hypothetical protein